MRPSPSGPVEWDALGAEAAELLAELIRVDTTNPPGNETELAKLVDARMRRHGIRGETVGADPRRLNYVARVVGRRPGPTLLLLSHLDVVPAHAEEWSVEPFSGLVRDGHVWGRGAVDMKNMLAAQMLALVRLCSSDRDWAGEVVLCTVADEEDGGSGVDWLIKNRPDLVRCDYVLNEGGGEYIESVDGRTHLLAIGERGTAQFRLTFTGEAGHAATPALEDSAVVQMARAVVAFRDYEPRIRLDSVPRRLIERCVPDAELAARLLDAATARDALTRLREADPQLIKVIAPLYGLTFAPTVVAAGDAVNVIPSRAELKVDCRTLPGQSAEDVREEIETALIGLDRDRWELEWLSVNDGNASAAETSFAEAIGDVMHDLAPGAELATLFCVGYTDSNAFRAAWPDVVAYGFLPHVTKDYFAIDDLFHDKDERIALRDLGFEVAFIERLIPRLLG